MRRVSLLFAAAFLTAPSAFAAEASTERGTSLFDARPQCMERDVHPDDPMCTLQDGPPARRFPLIVTPTPVPPSPSVPPANPQVPREGNRSGSASG